MDKIQSYRVFQKNKWSTLMANIYKVLTTYCTSRVQKQPLADNYKIGPIKDFAIIIGKHLCWSLFLRALQAWRPTNLLKRDSSISMKILKFLQVQISNILSNTFNLSFTTGILLQSLKSGMLMIIHQCLWSCHRFRNLGS